MEDHNVTWLSPAPLWREAGNRRDRLVRPSILRFATDSFMEDFLALLEHSPADMGELVARWETWREPMTPVRRLAEPIAIERPPRRVLDLVRLRSRSARAVPAVIAQAAAPDTSSHRLKLYQPAHQRYYLVISSLVCGRPGFPDRAIDAGRHERVSFVLRRLFPKQGALTDELPAPDPSDLSGWDEHAFVQSKGGPVWRRAEHAGTARVVGEEPLPLFPMTFADAVEQRRRLLAGVIPVGKREAYLGAPKAPASATPGTPENTGDSRLVLFVTQLIAPWKSLIGANEEARRKIAITLPSGGDAAEYAKAVLALKKDARERAQTTSWYLLVEFEELFSKHLPGVLQALKTGDASHLSGERREAEHALFAALDGLALSGAAAKLSNAGETTGNHSVYTAADVASSLGDALARLEQNDAIGRLDRAVVSYDREKASASNASRPDETFPSFLFPMADPQLGPLLPHVSVVSAPGDYPVEEQMRAVDALAGLIAAALPPSEATEPELAANARENIDPRDAWFVIRCVYERLDCGPLHAPAVSAPTVPFQLAAFFDPDAPARPIRIGLPIDPSPAGLRKFDKKTFVMMSSMLCGHIDRVKQLSLGDLVLSVLPFPFHKDLSVTEKGPCKAPGTELSLGLMCSLSLPIITLCAIILLIVMVSLLDLIFRWLPYFIVCFPFPGFKSKKGAES